MSQDNPQQGKQARQKGRHSSRVRMHSLRDPRRTLFGSGLTWLEWLWLGSIYGAVIIGMSFLGATLRPFYLSENLYNGPTRIYTSDGVLLAKLYEEYRVPVSISQVPEHAKYAILAAEDVRFYQHRGLDWRGITRAVWVDIRARRFVQGGSTITQQLVRYELLSNTTSLRRKSHEAILAVRVERAYSKDQILERYLNAVYFGDGAYGIGAAAQYYFGKQAQELTVAESALLAGLIRAPGEGNPRRNLEVAIRRQRDTLQAMEEHGWLTSAEYQQAIQETIALKPRPRNRWQSPYVIQAARQYLIDKYGRDTVYRGGMTVYTTIDSRMQRAGEHALKQAIRDGRKRRVGNGALIAIDPGNGFIRAMVGGKDFWTSSFNRATQAHRQPGSAFKAFVYQAAIDSGLSLQDTELDAPITIGNWSPKNYGRYHGRVTLQDALAYSLNTVSVRLTAKLSPYAVISAAQHAGIKSKLRPDLTIALGSSEVTPLEMASAFATYSNAGNYVEPSLIKAVYFKDQEIYRYRPVARQQVKPVTAFLLTQGLLSVVNNGTGRRAKIDRPAAGKTGTSNNFRDAWFVGYTPQLSAAVWLGNDNRAPMAGVAGGSLPAQAWASFMRTALQGVPPLDFYAPAGVTQVEICTVSGKLALPSCPSTRTIYVDRGQIPRERCDLHYWVTRNVCAESGLLPNNTCPQVEERAYPYFSAPSDRCPIDHNAERERLTSPFNQREEPATREPDHAVPTPPQVSPHEPRLPDPPLPRPATQPRTPVQPVPPPPATEPPTSQQQPPAQESTPAVEESQPSGEEIAPNKDTPADPELVPDAEDEHKNDTDSTLQNITRWLLRHL